jgi:hypothetical protein
MVTLRQTKFHRTNDIHHTTVGDSLLHEMVAKCEAQRMLVDVCKP